ncbi:hypothetical protein BU26DRAFT_505033 [Trematosphaeria pertusa]|uniref:Uncharacterized protein n=1 Tax=Trematosphaeria pertusa TaxID=390896 RepID=A0A6A6IFP7_9PLEO|nr:uncharacterized protein BU26DRAFT_505033 [Trematosphaeria pertusa]KAF2248908.1 hypothetical protein BU26DRAFT_505033 [Trematosphaeria pertusa]
MADKNIEADTVLTLDRVREFVQSQLGDSWKKLPPAEASSFIDVDQSTFPTEEFHEKALLVGRIYHDGLYEKVFAYVTRSGHVLYYCGAHKLSRSDNAAIMFTHPFPKLAGGEERPTLKKRSSLVVYHMMCEGYVSEFKKVSGITLVNLVVACRWMVQEVPDHKVSWTKAEVAIDKKRKRAPSPENGKQRILHPEGLRGV